jgi:flagellar basal body-associated protein FliL
MEALSKQLARSALGFAAAATVLVLTPDGWLRNMAATVQWYARSGVGLERILRTRPVPLLLYALFWLMMLVGAVSLVRCVTVMLRMARLASETPAAIAAAERPVVSERDEEARLEKKRIALTAVFVLSVPVMVLLPLGIYTLYDEIRWAVSTDFGVDRILRSNLGLIVLIVLGVLFAAAGLIALVRLIALYRRESRLRRGVPRASAERAVVSERGDADDKYLAQLDEYLKNGIIDKAEYKMMKERHERGRR